MDELIGNLKTYEIMKMQDKSKGEYKMEKNLVPKATKETTSAEDEETAYITKQALKALRKSGALCRRGESSRHMREGKANDTCHKCGKFDHYIKYCLLHKVEYKKYVKQGGEKKMARTESLVSTSGKLKLIR